MTAKDPVPSLTQQRLALGRLRLTALFMMIGWGAVAALRGLGGLDVAEVIDWIAFLLPLALALYGVKLWFDYRRKVRAFEAAHGPDAGKQP
ncbi:hypothetical protein [Microbacterium sp. GbtcB4]|jgi:hypothetical protein|uniref:hypothetical protein n=1 Tax=Microbacterium TaxID=33882 RepID=UPI001C2FAA25